MKEDSFLNGFAPIGAIIMLTVFFICVCVGIGWAIDKSPKYEEFCIEGIRYIKGVSSNSSFAPLIDKDSKPLECKREG